MKRLLAVAAFASACVGVQPAVNPNTTVAPDTAQEQSMLEEQQLQQQQNRVSPH